MSLRILDRALVLTRLSRQEDGQGGFREAWLPVSDIPATCRVADANAAERSVGGRGEATFTHYVWFHRRQDVERGDRLEFSDGTFLEVLSVWREDVPGGFAKCRAWQRQKGQ